MIITSLDNSKVKEAVKLKDKKYRDELDEYIIEGYRSVKDSLSFLSSYYLIVSESLSEKFLHEFDGDKIVVCSDKVFEKISDTENSQGIICVARKRMQEPDYNSQYALLLDRIRDPGNMGTIIRTALATGFSDIYCLDCVDPYNPKVVRSAMSALAKVNIFSVKEDIVEKLKSNGYVIFCADMKGENVFNLNFDFKKACLLVGNEANGVQKAMITMCDEVLSLPMESVESLNAGVSAAVLMYQLKYGRR